MGATTSQPSNQNHPLLPVAEFADPLRDVPTDMLFDPTKGRGLDLFRYLNPIQPICQAGKV